MSQKLPAVSLMQVKAESATDTSARFVIEPLSPGFGLTIGNALRRVLLSSLEGAAITSLRIDGVSHEFSTIKGVRQDVVDLILNLKQVRLQLDGDEPQVIVLDVKGAKKATAGDFKCPTGVKVVNKDLFLAELVEGGKLLLEATVERGRGYVSTEQRKEDKLPIGVIAIDSAFSPITKVNFEVENTRVGKMTNYDKLLLEVETDGSITPQAALETSAAILVDHFGVVAGEGALSFSVGKMNDARTEAADSATMSDSAVEDASVETQPVKKTRSKKSVETSEA